MSTNKNKGEHRSRTPGLLVIVITVVAVHAAAVFLPMLLKFGEASNPTTPEAWISRARELEKEGKLEQSLEAYNNAFSLRSELPDIWTQAEKERIAVRTKVLEQRRLAEEEKAQQQQAETDTAATTKPGDGDTAVDNQPADGDETPAPPPPDILDIMPEIGGDEW